MARQLETERDRSRSALSEMLTWVDGSLGAGSSDEGSAVTNIAEAQRSPGEVTHLRPSGSLPL